MLNLNGFYPVAQFGFDELTPWARRRVREQVAHLLEDSPAIIGVEAQYGYWWVTVAVAQKDGDLG